MMSTQSVTSPEARAIEVTLGDVLRPLLHHWPRLLLAIFIAGSFGLLVSFFMTPEHSATAILRVEPNITTSGEDGTLTDEADVIKTRAMMQAALAKLGYTADVYVAEPVFFGRLEKLAQDISIALGFAPKPVVESAANSLPWLDIESLYVDASFINKPIKLTVENDGFYRAEAKDGVLLAEGVIGVEARTIEENNDFYISMRGFHAPQGAEFIIVPRTMQAFVKKQLGLLSVEHRQSRQIVREGVLRLSLSSHHPFYAEKILGALVDSYVDSVVARSAAGATQKSQLLRETIADLDQKIIDTNLELAELRSNYGVVDVSAEMATLQQSLLQWQDKKVVLEGEIAVLQPFYGTAHPDLQLLQQQLDEANQVLVSLHETLLRLANMEPYYRNVLSRLEYLRLLQTRAIEQFGALLPDMQNITGYVRVINPAEADVESLWKWVQSYIAKGALAGGAGYAFWTIFLVLFGYYRLYSAADMAAASPVPVCGVIPRGADLSPALLKKPNDATFQALYGLASKWPFMTFNTKVKTVVITGLAPEQGATAIATLLAALNVMEGRRTILINTEILPDTTPSPFGKAVKTSLLQRLGHSVGVSRARQDAKQALGFSDIMVGRCSLAQAIVRYGSDKTQFDYVPAGTLVNNQRLLFGNPALSELLATVDSQYDCAIVNMPALSETLTLDDMAPVAGTVLVVARLGAPVQQVQSRLHYKATPLNQQPTTFLVINES